MYLSHIVRLVFSRNRLPDVLKSVSALEANMDASHTEWYHSKLLHYPTKHEKYYSEILQRNRESYLRLLHHEEEHKSGMLVLLHRICALQQD